MHKQKIIPAFNNKLLIILITGLACLSGQLRNKLYLQPGENIDILEKSDRTRSLCGLPGINLDEEIAFIEEMRLNNPQYFDQMPAPRILGKIYEEVGDIASFWVLQDIEGESGSEYVKIGAKLLAKGNTSAIWLDTLYLENGGNISDALAQEYIQRLETSTPAGSKNADLGIYDLEKLYFGNPPNKDGDGVIDFVFTKLSTNVAGYFTGNDQFDWAAGTLDEHHSNGRDILYITINMTVSYTEATLSHELQHLIHYNYDTNEESLYNEGLSELATIICGGDYISHSYYLTDPSIGWMWENLGIAQYSMASLFAVYYSEQLGLDAIKEFIVLQSDGTPLTGFAAFTELLKNRSTGLSFSQFFKNWYIANYLNDRSIDEKYGYDIFMPHKAGVKFNFTTPNQSESDNLLKPNSPNYVKYSSSADSMEITFIGSKPNKIQFTAMEYTENYTSVEDLSEDTPFLIKHDLEKVNAAVILVYNLSDSHLSYDFISSGEDQSEFSKYVEIAYDDGVNDKFTYLDDGSSSSFGWYGYGPNSKGNGWAMRFEPLMPQNQLVEFKFNALFEQEFSGSSLPADAEKDVEIHVWKPDQQEQRFTDVITPFIFTTQRPSFENDFMTVDLEPYAEELKNYKILYVGFMEDDNIGTYLALDKNKEGMTYTYSTSDGSNFVSLAETEYGNKTMQGWNFMMRASYFYEDTTAPVFSAGFFQNSVFTDELDLYVLGSSFLSPYKVSLSALNGGENISLSSASLPGNDSILVIRDYRLKSSGPLNFNIDGSLKYGTESVDTTFTFNVNYTLAKTGADFIIDAGAFNFILPPEALREDAYIISYKGNSNIFISDQKNTMENYSPQVYTVSPVGKILEKPALIKISIPEQMPEIDPEKLSIAFWNGNEWVALETTIIAGNRLQAQTWELGQYTIIESKTYILALAQNANLPQEFALKQNYPNPFNPSTTIEFDIPLNTYTRLTVFDVLGHEVMVLKDGYFTPGNYTATWNGKNSTQIPVVSGIYFYELKTEQFRQIHKMILIR